MRLETFSAASRFLDRVGSTLYANEAEDSLLLGVALRLAEGHRYGEEEPFLACVEEGATVPLIALRTPPYSLLLRAAGERWDVALGLLVEHLVSRGVELPGAHGRTDVVGRFAALWQRETGAKACVGMEQRLYRLTEVAFPDGVSGAARWATEDDVDILVPWAESFLDEAVPNDPRHDVCEMVERSVAAQALLVWEDGRPVSMCARSRPTPKGASIGLVYTPPAFRTRGYASACVAELSRRVLDSGKAYSTLFTNLANPTSNDIYQRIGYRPLCDFREIRFEASPARRAQGHSG